MAWLTTPSSARERARARCACGRPGGRRAGLCGRARRTPRAPSPSPAAARRRRQAAAAPPATRRAAALRHSARRPTRPPQAVGRRTRGRSGACHSTTSRPLPAVATGTGAAPLSPSSQSAPARAPAARVARRAIACPTWAPSAPPASASPAVSSASSPRRSSGSVPARQAASTAIWLAASRASVRSAWEKAPAERSSSTTPSRSPPASTGIASTLPEPARSATPRNPLAAACSDPSSPPPSESATHHPRAPRRAPVRRTPRRARRAGRKHGRPAAGRPYPHRCRPPARRPAQPAARPGRPARRGASRPVLDQPLHGVLPLSDAFRRRPS